MEISPVKAPLASAWAFWAKVRTLPGLSRALTSLRRVKGGATATSIPALGSMRSSIASQKGRASTEVRFIFQLATMARMR